MKDSLASAEPVDRTPWERGPGACTSPEMILVLKFAIRVAAGEVGLRKNGPPPAELRVWGKDADRHAPPDTL